ncbi:hypothetical protein [Algivirga pacifica]|uniref:Uncharacterized protein n=1 Tax=Algivirga pacifica TaxID=1162670 RepID=A0ABP9DCQ7_9BACT
MKTQDTTREQRFLFKKAQKAGDIFEATRREILEGKARFMDADVTHRHDITNGAGIYNLLLPTNDKIVGISDFQGNQLDPGMNVAAGRIKIGYGKAATAGNPKPQDIVYSSKKGDFPKELLNAKLIVIQDSKTLMKLPVERFTVGADSSKAQGEEDALALSTLLLLAERKEIKVQLEFHPSQEMPDGADAHFFEVRFIGTQTVSK